MNEINFVVRDDNTQKVYLSEENFDVVDVLNEDYPYICESIQNEGFILKYRQCNLFKELVCDRKVVGFCSYDFSRDFLTVALNNIYILPQFRGNRIFLKELENTMREHNKPSIMEPTRFVVELLVKYGFACKVSENIVASAIEFVVPGYHVLSNGDYENDELSTHFYDLEKCSCIHILNIDDAHVAYSAPLNYDIIHYDCIENRENMNEDYFIEITALFKESDEDFMEILSELEKELPVKNYTLEEVIGDEDTFSSYIESLIDDAHITYQKALEIKQQIRDEYESGMILNESLLIRLAYLFEDNGDAKIKSHDETCPDCGMPIDSHDRFCHFCGINLIYLKE
ncbi:GNAT family N-acetyltransferase [Methanobrevibacter sp.]|uniref:GNAT family N-acetyltransferase n=1 Tax=Methanobrevibacter sp. TaxID=66852 RepID=UPI0038641783